MGCGGFFKYYEQESDGKIVQTFMSIKSYGDGIVNHAVNESEMIVYGSINKRRVRGPENKVIFLTGREAAADEELIEVYLSVINTAMRAGMDCYIKDHPRENSRLNLKNEHVTTIDPSMPVELLGQDYSYAIGVCSRGLTTFKCDVVSLLGLLKTMRVSEKKKKMQFLVGIPGGERISFVDSIEQVEAVFFKKYHD